MTLSSAMLVGFTGIQSNSIGVDTVGDNLANLNTTAFKSQRTTFETLLYRTIREGEPPSDTSGGTLPRQIGTGSTVASIQRNFGQGGLDTTGVVSDLAVNGEGFFILSGPNGQQLFTRDGAFLLDVNQTLVSASGTPVQVFAADESGAVQTGSLSNLVIPLGSESEAVATTQVIMDGRLDPGTNLATQAAVVTSQALVTPAGSPATTATPLTDLVNADGLPLFSTGDELQVNASKGGIAIQPSTFIVGTTGATLGDLAQHALVGVDAAGHAHARLVGRGNLPAIVVDLAQDARPGLRSVRALLRLRHGRVLSRYPYGAPPRRKGPSCCHEGPRDRGAGGPRRASPPPP